MKQLTFYMEGAIDDTLTMIVDEGSVPFPEITTPIHPNKNAIFKGWALNPGGDIYTGSTILVNSNIDFYAVWEGIGTYSCILKGNGASGNVREINLNSGEMTILPTEPGFIHPQGYYFWGWCEDPRGGTLLKQVLGDKDYTLYAIWNASPPAEDDDDGWGPRPEGEFKYMFFFICGTFSCPYPLKLYTVNQKVDLSINLPFIQVMIDDNAGSLLKYVSDNSWQAIDKSTTLTEDGFILVYSIRSDRTYKYIRDQQGKYGKLVGGDEITGKLFPRKGKNVIIPADAYSRLYYYTPVSARYLFNLSYEPTENVTVTFDSNNGTGYKIIDRNIAVSNIFVLPYFESFFPVKKGYRFKGLAKSPNGNPIMYGDIWIQKDITLYAIWQKIETESVQWTSSSSTYSRYGAVSGWLRKYPEAEDFCDFIGLLDGNYGQTVIFCGSGNANGFRYPIKNPIIAKTNYGPSEDRFSEFSAGIGQMAQQDPGDRRQTSSGIATTIVNTYIPGKEPAVMCRSSGTKFVEEIKQRGATEFAHYSIDTNNETGEILTMQGTDSDLVLFNLNLIDGVLPPPGKTKLLGFSRLPNGEPFLDDFMPVWEGDTFYCIWG